MNTSYSLHKISDPDKSSFPASEYSWFKFGDRYYAEKFALQLFDGFIKNYGSILLAQKEIIIFPSPYLAIPTASNFLCYFFQKQLNRFLFENDKQSCKESKIHRNQTYITDYGNLDYAERIKLISNDTYYIDREFIDGKFCIFVDDIKITGSHELTVNKILNQYGAKGDFLFLYFAELINKEIHPKVENYFNYHTVKGFEEIIIVINRNTFHYNTRIVKYLLCLVPQEFNKVLNSITKERRNELLDLGISNNYHQIPEYKNNLQYLSNFIENEKCQLQTHLNN